MFEQPLCANFAAHCHLTPEQCGNRRLQQLANLPAAERKERVSVKRYNIPNEGECLFTTVQFAAGDLDLEYTGEIISTKECDKRNASKAANPDTAFYTFATPVRGRFFDGDPTLPCNLDLNGNLLNPAAKINHSCEPNTKAEFFNVRGSWRLGIYAIRQIKEINELYYNYGKSSSPSGWRGPPLWSRQSALV